MGGRTADPAGASRTCPRYSIKGRDARAELHSKLFALSESFKLLKMQEFQIWFLPFPLFCFGAGKSSGNAKGDQRAARDIFLGAAPAQASAQPSGKCAGEHSPRAIADEAE